MNILNIKVIGKLLLFLLYISFLPKGQSQVEKPTNFPAITTHTYGETGEGYVFLTVSTQVEGVGYYIFIMDNDGNLIKYKELTSDYAYDLKMQPNGELSYAQFLSHHTYTGGGNCEHVVMDQDMNILDTIQLKNRYIAEAHDFHILPNGHILMFGYYLTQMDLSQIVEGGFPDAKAVYHLPGRTHIDKFHYRYHKA